MKNFIRNRSSLFSSFARFSSIASWFSASAPGAGTHHTASTNRRTAVVFILIVAGVIAIDSNRLAARNESEAVLDSKIELSIEPLDRERNDRIRITIENQSDEDLVINLGMMLANGKTMIPDRFELIAIDASGLEQVYAYSNPSIPGVGGRIDDYLVPLSVSARYSFITPLDHFFDTDTGEAFHADPDDEIQIQVRLVGTDANFLNGDTEGLGLIDCWKDTAVSDSLKLFAE